MIVDALNQLIEEIILLDPNSKTDFSHLSQLLAELEESIAQEEYEELQEYLESIQSETSQQNLDELISKFQGSIESLRKFYENTGEDKPSTDDTEEPDVPDTTEDRPAFLDDPELTTDFLQESEEYLQQVEENLLALEADPEEKDRLDAIFRAFHTIKGVAGFLALNEIQNFAHTFEDLLDAVRGGQLAVTRELTDLVLGGVDALRGMLAAVEQSLEQQTLVAHAVDTESLISRAENMLKGDSAQMPKGDDEPEETASEIDQTPSEAEVEDNQDIEGDAHDYLEDPELVRDFLQESEEHLQSVEQNLIKWEDNPDDLECADTIFRGFQTIKGVAGFLNLTDINRVSHEFENVLDQARSGKLGITPEITDCILGGIDAIRGMTGAVASSLEAGEHIPHEIDVQELISRVTNLGTVETIADDKTDSGKTEPPGEKEKSSSKTPEDKTPQTAQQNAARGRGNGAIKVETSKMDYLIDMVGELVITQNTVAQNEVIRNTVDKRLIDDVAQLKRITSTLQNIAMSLRMVYIESTFRKMRRIVRDLAQKSGKKINLELKGEQTEIDRNMVESLYDPLVHMIRNACDHGIESPEERENAGKDAAGTITLNAYHKGGNVVIEIADDGAGLNTDALLAKAKSKGIVSGDEELSDQQIYDLLFKPGFSTAKTVTDVSGRGVGMDVVKRTIEKLRGQVEVVSDEGKGSAFYIKLPLTLAIIDGVIVRVGNEKYVVPTLAIEESIQPAEEDYNYIAGRGETIRDREQILPLIRLHKIFNVDDAQENPWDGIVMVVDSGGEKVGILVDQLIDKQEIVIKSMGEKMQRLPGISGGAILGDGTVGLILDMYGLRQVRDAHNQQKQNGEMARAIT